LAEDLIAGLEEIARRKEFTSTSWKVLEMAANASWSQLTNLYDVPDISSRACIYVTGSMARDEASEGSDLDLFVIDDLPLPKTNYSQSSLDGTSEPEQVGYEQPLAEENSNQSRGRLSYVESCRLIAALDNVRHTANFRPFSRGGEFIVPHSFQSLISEIGSPFDDASNTFTARLLLLLNSRVLLNQEAYEAAKREVFDSYWDRHDRDKPFFPIMLTNDIRRWWGVLGLNFERRNRRVSEEEFRSAPERRLENFKLRYAKLLGVYSSLMGLVDSSGEQGVLRGDAEDVLNATPVQRLMRVGERHAESNPQIWADIRSVLEEYDEYLRFVSQEKQKVLSELKSDETWKERKSRAYHFHKSFVKLFEMVGHGRTLYEYCVV